MFSYLWMGKFGNSLQFTAIVNSVRILDTFSYLFDGSMLYFTIFSRKFLQPYCPESTGAKIFISSPPFFLPHFPLARSGTRYMIHMLSVFTMECCLQFRVSDKI